MRIGKIQTGYYRLVRIASNITCAPLGTPTVVSFDRIDPMVDGREASLVKLFAVLPKMDITFPTSAPTAGVLDGVSLSQLVGKHSLYAADNSPFAQHGYRGKYIVNGMDGYRSSFLHGFVTGEAQFFAAGADIDIPMLGVGTAADVLNATDFGTGAIANWAMHKEWATEHSRPPQFLGPYGEFNTLGATATWKDNIVMQHSFVRDNAEREDYAFPWREMVGAPLGDSGAGAAGAWEITLGNASSATVDGLTMVCDSGTPTISVFGLFYVHGREEYSVPPTVIYDRGISSSNTIRLCPGPTAWAGFLKPLTGAGAMQTHSYQVVDLQEDGRTIQWSQIADLAQLMWPGAIKRKAWRPSRAETVITGSRNAARLSANGVPMVAVDGSIMRMPGSPDGLTFDVIQTGETTSFDFASATLTPTTLEMRAAAAQWAKIAPGGKGSGPSGVVVTQTRNNHGVKDARAFALPARVQVTAPVSKTPQSAPTGNANTPG